LGRAEVKDDGEVRGSVHNHDGEERYKVSLVLFSHSVSGQKLFSRPSLTISPRLLFRFVLKIFYGSIVVENPDSIPPDGQPWSVPRSLSRSLSLTIISSIVCANHSNSLTDALCVL